VRIPEHPVALALLAVPAWLYGAAVRLRNRHYDRPDTRRRAGLPVISVGNLTVGGTGKTPVVAWLARQLRSEGLRPAVVSRGYGGKAGKGPLVVSRGEGPLCGADRCGDEPHQLAATLPGTLVIVGSDRVSGAGEAQRLGADAVLLDDGYQHRRLARDLDILLLDAARPFGNRRLLPRGPLREPLSEARRADLVLITRSGADESFPAIEREVRRYNGTAPLLRVGHRPTGFVNGDGDPADTPSRAVAFCGIGDPGRFRIDLEALGVELDGFRAYADHHPYTAAEIGELVRLAAEADAPLVTTEKDLSRLGRGAGPEVLPSLRALRIEAEPHEPEALIRAVRASLRGTGE
jgi:tetraacyldisaccharide 4'-kinase